MRIFQIIAIVLSLLCLPSEAAAADAVPKQLALQVSRLAQLFSDGHAVGYPKATLHQSVKNRDGQEFVLVVFTVQGFGGGNMFSQYIALFERSADAKGKDYFSLTDVMSIGGKGWRTIDKLNPRVLPPRAKEALLVQIDATENAAEDAPNFPTRRTAIVLSLNDARMSEVKAP